MNLRELVRDLECGGKPQFSEAPVKILTEDGLVYDIEAIDYDPAGVDTAPTVWLKVVEDDE